MARVKFRHTVFLNSGDLQLSRWQKGKSEYLSHRRGEGWGVGKSGKWHVDLTEHYYQGIIERVTETSMGSKQDKPQDKEQKEEAHIEMNWGGSVTARDSFPSFQSRDHGII